MIGATLVVAALVLAALLMSGRVPYSLAPVVALLLLAGASFFGKVSRLAEQMLPTVGRTGHVELWGSPPPGLSGAVRVDAVRAVGAGLHFYLRPLPDGSSTHLKIAQPREVTIRDTGLEIAQAKYVQWAGRKIRRTEEKKPFVLVLEDHRLPTTGA